MKTLIINIKELLQVRNNQIDKVSGAEMGILPKITHAFLLMENNLITDFGPMANCPKIKTDQTIDATGKIV